jgi:hypothetical protein
VLELEFLTVRVPATSWAPCIPVANASDAPELFTPPACRKLPTSCCRSAELSTPGVVVTVRVRVLVDDVPGLLLGAVVVAPCPAFARIVLT